MKNDEPKVEVLLSAMHQTGWSLFDKTNVSTDALLINQCDSNGSGIERRPYGTLRYISTTQRGLSKSRNMALRNATGEICLIADDDECLDDGYADKIVNAYRRFPNADIVCVQLTGTEKRFSSRPHRIGFLRALRVSSWQITLKRERVLSANISFDERFGSGTEIGSGEENIFLYQCLKKKLNIYYVPVCIGKIAHAESKWFHGFDERYFVNRGIVIHELMGDLWGALYCVYFTAAKYNRYKTNLSAHDAFRALMRGMRNREFSAG